MRMLSVIRHPPIPLPLSVVMLFIPYADSVGTAMQKKKKDRQTENPTTHHAVMLSLTLLGKVCWLVGQNTEL